MEQFKTIGGIIDYAIALEHQAAELYQKLADQEVDGAKRDMMLGFVAEELGHKRRLQGLKAKAHIAAVSEKAPNLQFQDHFLGVHPKPHMSYRETLIFAMECEKSTIRLYLDFAENSSLAPIKDLFRALAKEEEKHSHRFEQLYHAAPREDFS
ncbi:MAG: hypothetical protein FJ220_06210 [Kiritimatiellaceae bacterium]|nr:hypothetical protein [Kiritimatiellaceae bacterium]